MSSAKYAPGQFVFSTTMSSKARVGFALAALLPLLVPYKLLIKTSWDNVSGLWLLFATIVSLGAIAVTVGLFLVALLGINRQVEFDEATRTVRVSESHLLQRVREVNFPFADIARLEIICHDWTTGPSTYELQMSPRSGKPIAFGDFSSRGEAEAALSSLRSLAENAS